MKVNGKLISKIIAYVSVFIGLCMMLPGIVSFGFGEPMAGRVYVLCGLATVIAGSVAVKLLPQSQVSTLKTRDGFFIVSIVWFGMSLIGAVPMVLCGDLPDMASAFFETASGFTTTGSTVINDIEALSHATMFWRSETHWLGGMGVLVMTIALLPRLGISGQKIMRAETTGLTLGKSNYTFSKGARDLYKVYIGLTIAEFLLLMLVGFNWFDAITHTFGTVGTGGFSTKNASVGHFNNLAAEMIISVFMLICGINFSNLYLMCVGKFKKAFMDLELKVYLAIVAVAIGICTISLTSQGTYAFGHSLRASIFQVSSIITTTGFGTENFDMWPETCRLILVLLMIIGSCAGSTGGGIKVIRLTVLSKLITRGAKRKVHPNNITPIKMGRESLGDDIILDCCGFVALFAFTTVIGCLLLSFEGIDLITNFTAVIAALSNIGPGLGMVGPTCTFSFFSPASKLLLGALMIGGRLELYTLFIMLRRKN